MLRMSAVADLTAEQIISRLDTLDRTALLALEADVTRTRERGLCAQHPAHLFRYMKCWDERAGVEFGFNMDDPEGDWGWQRKVVDLTEGGTERIWYVHEPALSSNRTIYLKARQIGVTWIGCGRGVKTALYKPGSLSLFYRQKEEDAVKLVQRAWYQLRSLPHWLWNGAKVLKPTKGAQPTTAIVLGFPDGSISRIQAQSSADASGMGETAAFALLDEFAWIENAPAIMKSVSSAVGQDGKLMIISTANGVSNDQGGGNYFHYLWVNAEEQGLLRDFLSWRLHPDRDDEWLRTSPEVLNLRPWERSEQYPSTPEEAFALSSAHFFDEAAIHHYGSHIAVPEYRFEFEKAQTGKARKVKKDTGWIRVYKEPDPERKYAIGADTATGKGLDYSAAFVVDLTDLTLCAEFHGKLDVDQYAEQLHFLARWYGSAKLAVEDAGGFGDAVIVGLRDGRDGRPAYPNLYRHRQFTRGDLPEHKPYGFPLNKATRPLILGHMEELLRERAFESIPEGLLEEIKTFCRFNPAKPEQGGVWPRACPDGLHDDRVMACAIALELYRQFGHHAEKFKPKRSKRGYMPRYPWEKTAA